MDERKVRRIYHPPAVPVADLFGSGKQRRVAAYARVSTASDEQLNSVEAQKDYFEKLIQRRPDWIFVGVYADEGITGTSINRREAFNQMVSDALAGHIDLIVTKSISRFARNTVDTLNTIRQLKAVNVEVFFEKENIYTMDSKGEFLITLLSSIAEEESRSISENVKWGQRKRFADGKYSVPYKHFLGYRKGSDGSMEIVPEEAKVVRWIYHMFLEGIAPTAIATILTTANIPSPAERDQWWPKTVMSILTNEKYYGAARLQKTYIANHITHESRVNNGELPSYFVENGHPGIVPKAVFMEVQDRLLHPDRNSSSFTLFANQIRCADCGGTYGRQYWHSTTYNNPVWKCNHKHLHHGDCRTPHLYEVLLIGAFRDVIQILYDNYPQVQEDCLATINRHCKYPITPEDMPSWSPAGYPTQEERSLWDILIPKVVVQSDGTLVFHIIDGAEIPYIMQQTSPLRRKPLSPEERAVVIEAYNNGVPSRVLAERYECSPATIRAIARRLANNIDKTNMLG